MSRRIVSSSRKIWGSCLGEQTAPRLSGLDSPSSTGSLFTLRCFPYLFIGHTSLPLFGGVKRCSGEPAGALERHNVVISIALLRLRLSMNGNCCETEEINSSDAQSRRGVRKKRSRSFIRRQKQCGGRRSPTSGLIMWRSLTHYREMTNVNCVINVPFLHNHSFFLYSFVSLSRRQARLHNHNVNVITHSWDPRLFWACGSAGPRYRGSSPMTSNAQDGGARIPDPSAWPPFPSCLHRGRREEVGPCDRVLTWGTEDLSDINSMVLNKLRLAERQRKKLIKNNSFHFLRMTTTCFIPRHPGADGTDRWRDGRTSCSNPESQTFEAFGFCRAAHWKQNNKHSARV